MSNPLQVELSAARFASSEATKRTASMRTMHTELQRASVAAEDAAELARQALRAAAGAKAAGEGSEQAVSAARQALSAASAVADAAALEAAGVGDRIQTATDDEKRAKARVSRAAAALAVALDAKLRPDAERLARQLAQHMEQHRTYARLARNESTMAHGKPDEPIRFVANGTEFTQQIRDALHLDGAGADAVSITVDDLLSATI